MFTGPNGNFSSASTGTALIEDLSQARQLWRSQESDIGDAKKLSQPPAWNNDAMPPSGVASPIVAEDTLFVSYYTTRGEVFDTGIEATIRGAGRQFNRRPYLIAADDVMLAIDANTGRTRWKMVEEDKGMNFVASKRGGWGVSPAFFDGAVFALGTTGRLYAYEADSGRKRWETPLGAAHESAEAAKRAALQARRLPRHASWLSSLTVADGVLIVPTLDGAQQGIRGVDPRTGRTLWETPNVLSRLATPAQFRAEGRTYLLANTSTGQLRCLDPRDGRVLWTVEGLGNFLGTLSPSDEHVILNVRPSANNETGLYGAYRISPQRAERAWSLPAEARFAHEWHLDGGAIHKIVARDGLAYITIRIAGNQPSRLLILRERTGEILADRELGGGWGWLPILTEDRLLIADDLSHTATNGGYRFSMISASDPFRAMGESWRPSHRPTNGYEVPMVDPIVAGRWYMRSRDGHAYCYDLRRG